MIPPGVLTNAVPDVAAQRRVSERASQSVLAHAWGVSEGLYAVKGVCHPAFFCAACTGTPPLPRRLPAAGCGARGGSPPWLVLYMFGVLWCLAACRGIFADSATTKGLLQSRAGSDISLYETHHVGASGSSWPRLWQPSGDFASTSFQSASCAWAPSAGEIMASRIPRTSS